MGKCIDLTNQIFGKLIVIKENGTDKRGEKKWLCKCECGNEINVLSSNLRTGHTLSCGCYRLTRIKEVNSKHNLTGSKIYTIWSAMKRRCYQKKCKDYIDYGHRGIIVCDEWKNDFLSFYNWAMSSGYSDGLSIDRIDTDGNYEPNNCKWSTNIEQANNKRNNRRLKYNGKNYTVKEWSRITGINYYTLMTRIRSGWSTEDILTKKIRK